MSYRDKHCDTKKAENLCVGDQLVERDGYLLTVTSVRHTTARVILGLRSFRGPLNDKTILKGKLVYVPKGFGDIESPPDSTVKHVTILRGDKPRTFVVRRLDPKTFLPMAPKSVGVESKTFEWSADAHDAAQAEYPNATVSS